METDLIHIILVLFGYGEGQFGEDSVSSHFVSKTVSVATEEKEKKELNQDVCKVHCQKSQGLSDAL